MSPYSQESDFQFFLNNHDSLFKEYPNKFLVIKNGKVLFAEDSFEDALRESQKNGLELGTFVIQECTEGSSAYTQEFHSRVALA